MSTDAPIGATDNSRWEARRSERTHRSANGRQAYGRPGRGAGSVPLTLAPLPGRPNVELPVPLPVGARFALPTGYCPEPLSGRARWPSRLDTHFRGAVLSAE